MPIINLIQEQRVAEQRRDQRTRIAGYTFLITVGFGALGFIIIFFQKSACQAEISRLNQEIATNKPIMKQIDDCKAEETKMQPRLDTLSEAEKVSGKWSDILTHLETQTPAGTWLTGMQCPPAKDDKPISITFTGTAMAQEPISEFTLRTQNDPCLDNVVLHFTQEKRTTNGDRKVDFEVGAEVAGSAAEKSKVKEDTKS